MVASSSGLAPIAIMSFNRPDYLARVLHSLAGQRLARLEDREIVLFQDGAHNAASGIWRAQDADIDASVELFRSVFPGRRVERSATNLGVALNFERAETYMFQHRNAEAAVFLEDDMVLAPLYVRVLDRLIELSRFDNRIGYVAAYGRHGLPLSDQYKVAQQYTEMDHNWGFALTKRQWLLNRPYVNQYLALVRHVDYMQRPARDIERLFASWRFSLPGTSQDVAKGLACCATGAVRLNTSIVLARYIGERGVHMDPATFARRGYDAAEVYDGDIPDFVRPTDADYRRIRNRQADWARNCRAA